MCNEHDKRQEALYSNNSSTRTWILSSEIFLGSLLGFSHPSSCSETSAGVHSVLGTELFFNAEKLVVFSQAFGSAWSTRFDLTSAETNREISNVCVFGLTRAMRRHDTPSRFFRLHDSGNRFGNGSNLVDFQQQACAGLFINRTSDLFNIGDS